MDVHIPIAITKALRKLGVDILTAQEDASQTLPDPLLLDRARAFGRVAVTQDTDFLVEGARYHQKLTEFVRRRNNVDAGSARPTHCVCVISGSAESERARPKSTTFTMPVAV
jgi:predicted nuclease of predicted toxin-antitoxin system